MVFLIFIHFLENQKVILQKFWKNKHTVTSGIGKYTLEFSLVKDKGETLQFLTVNTQGIELEFATWVHSMHFSS